jgi:2-amino-4-hydroxy-6-hydroxymethyldihydropteridine diphosphokinase
VAERVFVAVGSNLGDRLGNVLEARRRLALLPSVEVIATSPLFNTPAMITPGSLPQPEYLNGVFELRAGLDPGVLLDALLRTERQMGRRRSGRWAPRVIDLDLVLFADCVLDEPGLTLPHPGLTTRRFVLEPLAALAPALRHPVTGRTIRDHLRSVLKASRD